MTDQPQPPTSQLVRSVPQKEKGTWLWILLLFVTITLAVYFRFTGLFWGEYSFLHPDERFFIQVTSHITPVQSLGAYFDTARSTLNPHNVGDTFFVYGTFPIIATRYLANAVFTDVFWEQLLQTGRVFSALMDLATVLLVYLLGTRLFNRKIGVLGAAFSAFAVMQIQQSHFYTADSFSTTFTTLALYFAARLATQPVLEPQLREGQKWFKSESARNSLWFGVAMGFAMACKINTALMVVLLPAAWFIFVMRHPRTQRDELIGIFFRDMVIGAAAALLLFRIFNPYAFNGPGFFGLLPNEKWIANLRELASQMTGNVDFPPALQWARRPLTFSFTNMVLWGMGLPMGILAWGGFIWMGIRQLNGTWKRSILVWGWTAIYFVWQSMQGNPTMRYELPIYPTLAITAAWALWNLWETGRKFASSGKPLAGKWLKIGSVVVGVVTLAGTFAWAFAFTRIYERPMTRVEASRWMLDNVPGPVNLVMDTADGEFRQMLPYNPALVLTSGDTVSFVFTAESTGLLSSFQFTNIQDLTANTNPKTLGISVYSAGSEGLPSGYGLLNNSFTSGGGVLLGWSVPLAQPVTVQAGQQYRVELDLLETQNALGFSGAAGLTIQTLDGMARQELPVMMNPIRPLLPGEIRFMAMANGQLNQVNFNRMVDVNQSSEVKTLKLSIADEIFQETPLAEGEIVSDFAATGDPRGQEYTWQLTEPLHLVSGTIYSLRMELISGDGALTIHGSAPAVETPWDDSIPIRLDGYDPYAGIYEGDLNFEMYWDDSVDKLARFEAILDRADYFAITSNRQYGTTTRVPERYPLTTVFYRELIGCPLEVEVIDCYRTVQVGDYSGRLGFELVKVFQSDPSIGPFRINDQFAEEAFTVYDHPKVLIFKKSADYSQSEVESILRSVDISNVIHVIPGQAPNYPADLMLPQDMAAVAQAGGTWSEMFDTDAVINQYPGLGAIVWYLAILILGLLIYPILRIAMKGLPDLGYPLAKIAGLLLLAWLVWMAGSSGLSFSRGTIWMGAGLLVAVSLILAIWQREAIRVEIKQRWRYYLTVEAVGLVFFLLFLAIRLGNPDLWHPNYGGEKPMDFAYFNAVLKSTTFPPYNPWYAGAWINYYYYGFVITAVPTKWLGIVPSVAYNLILPTFFSLVALGAYSFGWNVQQWFKKRHEADETQPAGIAPWIAGVGSAIGMLILGNLGTIDMMWEGVMKLAAPGGNIEGANFFTKIAWTFQGLGEYFKGAALPYSPADWYWIPSRAVKGGDAITEFPFFTFLYGDPHAHLFALPITLLALGWVLSIVLGKWQWKIGGRIGSWLPFGVSIFFGAVTIGALRPVNTWDLPTYLGLAIAAICYSALRYAEVPQKFLPNLPHAIRRIILAVGSVLLLTGLAFVLYQPYQNWYAQGYSEIDLWQGAKTTLADYLTHWGLFVVIIITWLFQETIDWMEKTPVSALNKLRPWKTVIAACVALFMVVVLFLTFQQKVPVAWLALTLAVWSLLLLLRPGQPDPKRAVLFMVGTAAVLTLAVEVVVLVGDINRMNTVFKFYLQAWTLFSLSAAAGLFLLWPQIERRWKTGWRNAWTGFAGLLIVFSLFYPLTAAPSKIRDRISTAAPHTLDGMAYMQTAQYHDQNGVLDLKADYGAIRWLQENVIGSPVIVEANTVEYRWGSRISIYTGLPATIGWNWHQRQQRATIIDTSIWARIDDVNAFYNTTDLEQAVNFLRKYNVKYIIVGELERVTYDPLGIAKFARDAGQYWQPAYSNETTAIYEVMQ
ncbi:MAG TPA: DUF2298 domain-containing protein [Bellilinea sp.]|nr:DUF2298 domain-containing protein [Bellilinea sp.]